MRSATGKRRPVTANPQQGLIWVMVKVRTGRRQVTSNPGARTQTSAIRHNPRQADKPAERESSCDKSDATRGLEALTKQLPASAKLAAHCSCLKKPGITHF